MVLVLVLVLPAGVLVDDGVAVEATPVDVEAPSAEPPAGVTDDLEGLLRLMTGATTVTAGAAGAEVGDVLMEPVRGPLE